MKLRLTPRALNDLHEICDFVRERNPAAARRVADAIQAGLRVIATYPLAGVQKDGAARRFVLPRYPYLIYYGVDDIEGEIHIFTIRHAARKEETAL